MPEESVRDLVRYVRGVLQEKGPAGAFLLSELDSAISRGVEDLPLDNRKKATPSEITGRRTPNEAELLGILCSVFETYLVTLPAVARSLTTYLHEHDKVDHIEITLDPSLLGDELQQTGRARIDSIVPLTPDEKVVVTLRQINALVMEANNEGE